MYVSVFLAVYGIQHYLSIIGSLILTPLVIAPAMGASHVSSHFSFSIILVMFLFLANIFCEYYFLLSDVLVAIGWNCSNGMYCALSVWSDYTPAHYFWVSAAVDTRAFFCLSGSGFGYHQLTWVSRVEWKCMYFLKFLSMFYFILIFVYIIVLFCNQNCSLKFQGLYGMCVYFHFYVLVDDCCSHHCSKFKLTGIFGLIPVLLLVIREM